MKGCPFGDKCQESCALYIEAKCAFTIIADMLNCIADELILRRIEHERNLERYELMIKKGKEEL